MGLIQWVEGTVPLFRVHEQWRLRTAELAALLERARGALPEFDHIWSLTIPVSCGVQPLKTPLENITLQESLSSESRMHGSEGGKIVHRSVRLYFADESLLLCLPRLCLSLLPFIGCDDGNTICAVGKPITDEAGRSALRATIKLPRAVDAFYARLVPALKVHIVP